MSSSDRIERQLREYMLGLLPPEEEERFEERLVSETEFFRETESLSPLVEDELVEEYLDGVLSSEDRAAFEQRLLVRPEISDKLLLLKALRAASGRAPAAGSRLASWFQSLRRPLPALATALVLALVVFSAWATVRVVRLSERLKGATSEVANLKRSQLQLQEQIGAKRSAAEQASAELQKERARATELQRRRSRPSPAAAVASFLLTPGLQRGAGSLARIPRPESNGVVELRLDIGSDDYPSYRATLVNAAGEEILSYQRLTAVKTARSAYLPVWIAGNMLRIDDYRLRVSGVTASGELDRLAVYAFRIIPR